MKGIYSVPNFKLYLEFEESRHIKPIVKWRIVKILTVKVHRITANYLNGKVFYHQISRRLQFIKEKI